MQQREIASGGFDLCTRTLDIFVSTALWLADDHVTFFHTSIADSSKLYVKHSDEKCLVLLYGKWEISRCPWEYITSALF